MVCTRKDFLEHRYKVLLFAPDEKEEGERLSDVDSEESGDESAIEKDDENGCKRKIRLNERVSETFHKSS